MFEAEQKVIEGPYGQQERHRGKSGLTDSSTSNVEKIGSAGATMKQDPYPIQKSCQSGSRA